MLSPATVDELYRALDHARQWSDVGTVLLTGNGLHHLKMGDGHFVVAAIKEFEGKLVMNTRMAPRGQATQPVSVAYTFSRFKD